MLSWDDYEEGQSPAPAETAVMAVSKTFAASGDS